MANLIDGIYKFEDNIKNFDMPIPLAIPLIMAAVGAGTKIAGAIKGGKAMEKQEGVLAQQRAELDSWYNVEKNIDFLQTDVARSAMSKILQNIEDQNRIVDSSAGVTGASDAAVIASKAKNQRRYDDVVKDIMGYGTMRRDNLDKMYLQGKQPLYQMQRDIYAGRAQNAAILGAAGGQLFSGAASLLGGTKWGEGVNSASPTTPDATDTYNNQFVDMFGNIDTKKDTTGAGNTWAGPDGYVV